MKNLPKRSPMYRRMRCFPAVHLAIYYEITSTITITIFTYMIPIMSTLTIWIAQMIVMNFGLIFHPTA